MVSEKNLVIQAGEQKEIEVELNLPVLNTNTLGPESAMKMELHIPGYLNNFPACADGDLIDIALANEVGCSKPFPVSV